MKKTMLIVVGLLLTLFSYSQDFNRVIVASKSEWTGEEWKIVATDNPKEMFVILKDWNLTIGEKKYRTYDAPEKTTYETHMTYDWKCINGEGEKCHFMIKKFKPEVSSHMVYCIVYDSGIMYSYECE
jgi:predicted alpha/beta superfamily hydrolase